MAVKLKIKRGLASNLNSAGVVAGELKYTTDTERVYIGNGSTNKAVGGTDVVFENESQTLQNKTVNAKNNNIYNLDTSNFEEGVIKGAIKSDYYYGWYFSSYKYTKQVTTGIVEVFDITVDNVTLEVTNITSLGYGNITNGTLTYNSTVYTRADAKDDFYVVGASSKIPNINALVDFYDIVTNTAGNGVVEVDSLPTTHDQTKIYKIPNSNVLWWWNGTEYADISSEAGMVEVTTFPTGTDIKQGLLYKLTQDVSHLGDARYLMVEKEFTEDVGHHGTGYEHDTSNNEWYHDGTIINVTTASTLPEPEFSINNNYYYVSNKLYQCQLVRPTIIDYYAGVYAYFNNGWRALYTQNMMVDYNTGIAPSSLPYIGGKVVMGSHDITYYGGVTNTQIQGTYQPKTMDNPLAGFTSDTVEGTLAELNTKVSSATRIKGGVPTYNDLPASPSTGDMYVVKNYTDPTTSEEKTNVLFCYNGVDWFEYGSSDIDMSSYQKFEEKIDSLKAANPSLTFTEASTVAMNDKFTLVRLEATLQSPVTDLQSPDRTIMTIPNDIDVTDGQIEARILTHAGQITAMENVPDLPSGISSDYGRLDYILAFDETKIVQAYKMTYVKFLDVKTEELEGNWYEHDEDTDKYYYNGTELTLNVVSTLPEPTEANRETYYALTSPLGGIKVYVSELTYGIKQDVNQHFGTLLFKPDGMPAFNGVLKTPTPKIEETSQNFWVLDTDNMSAIGRNYIVGYAEETGTRFDGTRYAINVPLYRCKQITLAKNVTYIEACRRMDSGLNVDTNGRYGYYTIQESDLSLKYSQHGRAGQTGYSNCPHGFDGTFTFTPINNESKLQPLRYCYIEGKKIKTHGDVTIDKIYMTGIWS